MKRILEIKKQIGNLSKNSENPFFKSAYLDLTELLNHVEPLLWEQDLVLVQPIIDNRVCSTILDTDGKTLLESSIELPDIKDPQKLGSAITYYRRYTLKSLLAIAEVDDDGNKASQPVKKTKPVFTVNSKAWHTAIKKKLSVPQIEQHYSVAPEVADKYLASL
jgi:hypothetical protein